MINISYLPNIERDDFLLTLKVLFKPWEWKRGKAEEFLKNKIKEVFNEEVFLTASGREALWLILRGLGVNKGDEVIVQAFTCVAVINPILTIGAKPVYVDIDDEYNLDISNLKRKISQRTKAVIVQHTFGLPAKIEEILSLARKNNLFVIEDLAHSFGGELKGRKLGTFGDAAFLSFGRTKVLSSMFGGAAVMRKIGETGKITEEIKKISYPSSFWIAQQLFHQIIFYILTSVYDFFGLGKGILFFLSKLGLLSREVEDWEKKGEMGKRGIIRMPNALCNLALLQLKKIEFFLKKRKEISQYYQINLDTKFYKFPPKKLPYLRFPVEVKSKEKLVSFAKKRGIYLGDWYSQPVAPANVNLKKMGYKLGSCQESEGKNKLIVNLPTSPTLNKHQMEKVVEILNEFKSKRNY